MKTISGWSSGKCPEIFSEVNNVIVVNLVVVCGNVAGVDGENSQGGRVTEHFDKRRNVEVAVDQLQYFKLSILVPQAH
jgi:hypothetical protein